MLETRLYQLARLEIDKIRAEQREKEARAKEIERLLQQRQGAVEAWSPASSQEVAKQYGDERRTVLKRRRRADLRRRGVRRARGHHRRRDPRRLDEAARRDQGSQLDTRVREGDQARWILRGNTRDTLALFSNLGVAYVMKVGNVPATTGYGEPVQSLLNFKDGERIISAALVAPAATARKKSPTRSPARRSCSAAAGAARKASGAAAMRDRGPGERRRAEPFGHALAGRQRLGNGLSLLPRPERDDAQRAALRTHQRRG